MPRRKIRNNKEIVEKKEGKKCEEIFQTCCGNG